jgi:two-component system, NtrC family, nitrogen regulation response regulator GlnG
MRYDTNCSKKTGVYHSAIEAAEKPLIENTLERTLGNQIKAAELLGINRNTLRSKIRKLGIEIDRWKQ